MTLSSRLALLAAGTTALGISVAGCLGDGTGDWEQDQTLPVASATQYQGPSCDCCDVYADYLQDHLESELDVTVTDELDAVKQEHGIERDLRSCHTVVLDEYVVEGHMPVEGIETLFDDEPAINGIALPGMPAGSPGMGGEKTETWTVYGLEDGSDPSVYTDI
ncbi:metal-binding protein [Natronolimnobius sp. AArcel1]|uniref:DUF411 domain-containing protein n=1 Tax=Natronolimnobius sp. AArcel1 TaxID=1679093 RepID=UPI0013EBF6A7|nr:DUF411 domain-containing protein [Natronolimnobius sp. AArcel1]NGM68203.1 metal-binding protein [Natronolimnobius sp. AArcel1]